MSEADLNVLFTILCKEKFYESCNRCFVDPKSTTEEALGGVGNALASAYDFKHNGDDVTVLFRRRHPLDQQADRADHRKSCLKRLKTPLLGPVVVLMCLVPVKQSNPALKTIQAIQFQYYWITQPH